MTDLEQLSMIHDFGLGNEGAPAAAITPDGYMPPASVFAVRARTSAVGTSATCRERRSTPQSGHWSAARQYPP